MTTISSSLIKRRQRRVDDADMIGRVPVTARFGLLFIVIGIVALFSIARPDTYFTVDNFASIATSQAITAVMALSILGVLTVGEFDLAFASIFGIAQVLVVGLIVEQGVAWPLAIVAVLLVGVLCGLTNAFLSVKLKISSFVATLAVATILDGFAVGYTDGQVVSGELPTAFTSIGQKSIGAFGLPVVYVLVVAVALFVVLEYSATGRRMLAVGGNRSAAELAGISIGRSVAIAFVLAGVIAAIAAIMSGSQLGSAQPLLAPAYLLPAYAGAFLGATAITPGRFNVWGTLIGVYLLGAGVTGLQQIGLEDWIQQVFTGSVLIAAVAFSGYLTRRPSQAAARHGREASRDAEPTDNSHDISGRS